MALTIYGTNSSDTITGTSADELIYGYEGTDLINGAKLKDTIYGGKNADTLLGGDGYDVIFGDTGDDSIEGGKGEDTISGGEGNDFLYGNTGSDSINGGKGNDYANGGDGQDTIYGDTGNDTIDGAAGYDSLIGGDGNDVIFGGGGFDTIDGGKNDDILYGNEGNDLVLGQSGNDLIFGGTGTDTLQGQSGDDSIYGEQGSDLLQGGEGNDVLVGDNGSNANANLIVNGSFEANQLGGGWGVFSSITGWTSTIGTGIEVEYGNTAGLLPSDGNQKIELDSHNFTGNPATPTNSNMWQNVATGEGSFTLTFDYSARPGVGAASNPIEVYWNGQLIDTLTSGTAGWTTHSYDVAGAGETTKLEFRAVGTNDTLGGFIDNVKLLTTTGNNDTLEGGSGNDTLSGGFGNDSLSGGTGSDVLAGGVDTGSFDVSTTVSSSFVGSNAGWSNSYGFYTTDNSGNPVSGTIIWSNVHGATPDFSTAIAGLGENMGFFILENGATNAGLSNGDAINFQNVDGKWTAFKGATQLQTAENAVFFSDETLNADNYDHDIQTGQTTGWEDLLGGGDNDYNDVVVISGINTTVELHGGDTLIGGEGQDIFSYQVGVDGVDKIRDFTIATETADTLKLIGVTSGDVQFTNVNGNSALVTFNGVADDAILLTGVNAADVAAHTIYA